jgi:hypothetical protein
LTQFARHFGNLARRVSGEYSVCFSYTGEEIMAAFRATRDEVEDRVRRLLTNLDPTAPRRATLTKVN